MRVLWVVKGLGPGGAERLLTAAAAEHDHDECTIECAYVLPWKDHLAGDLEAAGVRTHCVSTRRGDRLWPLRLSRLVRNGNFDVVHVHSPVPGSVARFAARTMRAAARPGVVSTEHNRWATHRVPTRLANRLTSRWNDECIAVTEEVRRSMGGSAGRLATTLRHGIDVDAAAARRAHRADVRAELGIGADEFVVGTVANFREQKDYPNLLAAARLLADRDVAVRIVAVGQGPQDAEIRALHHELGLGERVLLTGFRNDAVRVMAACDAFTLASRWEGLPVAVMEALALGLPIVATAVGGMAEELHDDVDALLVPPGDAPALAAAIERVATSDELRARLATAASARAPEFGVGRTVSVIEDVYARVARRPPASANDPDPRDAQPTPRTRGGRPTLDIRVAVPDDHDEIIELLRESMGDDGDPRYPELYMWKHDRNRFGPSPRWVATDGGRVVAFRAFMRWEFVRGGHVVRAVRAVDTATHPDYRGRGLFRALTMHGLEQLHADGVDLVFNTPNDQSRPGYLTMGWREVGRLPAAVRVTGPAGSLRAAQSRVAADRWSSELGIGHPVVDWLASAGVAGRISEPTDVRELRTNIDDEYLSWRFGEPMLAYRAVDDGDSAVIVRSRTRGRARELAVVAEFGEPVATQRLAARAAADAGCDYAIRIGRARPTTGFVPLPGGGPVLTWRAVTDAGMPPLANWALSLGDVELF